MSTLIHIFRTNIDTHEQKEVLKTVFGGNGDVVDWSVDLEDVDRVLRLVCTRGEASAYLEQVRGVGFSCEELE